MYFVKSSSSACSQASRAASGGGRSGSPIEKEMTGRPAAFRRSKASKMSMAINDFILWICLGIMSYSADLRISLFMDIAQIEKDRKSRGFSAFRKTRPDSVRRITSTTLTNHTTHSVRTNPAAGSGWLCGVQSIVT